MSMPTSVVDLNNEAVSFLQGGNYRAAVLNLDKALEQLNNPQNCSIGRLPESGDGGVLRVTSVPIAPCHHPESTHNIFDFYRRAFQIVSRPAQHPMIHPISNAIVVKFNMAIAYHDDAVRRNRLSHYIRALAFYEEILYLMHQHGIKGHMLLLLAIGNNMGHIHSHLLNFQQTREALFWVRQLAVACEQHVSTVPYNDFTFFYKTAVIFNGNDLIAAPAA